MHAIEFCRQDIAPAGSDWALALRGTVPAAGNRLLGLLCFAARVADIPHRASEPAVAHTQFAWWRAQLADDNATPATRHPSLQAMGAWGYTSGVRERLDALIDCAHADLNFAGFATAAEADTFFNRRAAVFGALCSDALCSDALSSDEPEAGWPAAAQQAFGRFHAYLQVMHHFRRDAGAGLIYFPEDALRAHGLEPEQLLRPQRSEAFRAFMSSRRTHEEQALASELAGLDRRQRQAGRPLLRWLRLQRAWLKLTADDGFQLYDHRLETGPLLKRLALWQLLPGLA